MAFPLYYLFFILFLCPCVYSAETFTVVEGSPSEQNVSCKHLNPHAAPYTPSARGVKTPLKQHKSTAEPPPDYGTTVRKSFFIPLSLFPYVQALMRLSQKERDDIIGELFLVLHEKK